MNISVIICCYNSEQRIVPSLEHLLKQSVPVGLDWEVVLVDNNCTDGTTAVAKDCWEHPDVPLRIVEEPTPGLSAARDCGVNASNGDYVLFCDDDNWLAPDYLALAFNFMNSHSDYAAIGGWGDVVSDSNVEIPEWFNEFETKYACGKTGNEGNVDILVGAGMFIRKNALKELSASGFQSLLSDRKGAALSSGGDLELSMALRVRGWKLHFSEAMYFKHYMPEGRLTEEYLLRMCHGHGRSRPILSEYKRLITGGAFARWTLTFLPIRIYLRRFKRILSGSRPISSLADRVSAATNAGANESEKELLDAGGAWTLARRIAKNVQNVE